MASPTIRYLNRFLLFAAMGTVLMFCLISALRALYIQHIALKNARQQLDGGQPVQAVAAMKLAILWSGAYPILDEQVQILRREAVARADAPLPLLPDEPDRAWLGIASPWEKALILPDRLVSLVLARRGKAFSAKGAPEPSALVGAPSDVMRPPAPTERFRPLPTDAIPSPTASPAPAMPPAPAVVIQQPSSDPNAMWGAVISDETALFDREGRRLRTVPAGSLVDVSRVQQSPNGEIITGTVHSRDGRFTDVILRRDDTDLYTGARLADSTLEQRTAVSKRAETLGAIEARQKAVAAAALDRNPYQEPLRRVLGEYQKLAREAENLKRAFDAANGAQRMDIANRLRELKNEQAIITPRYRDLRNQRDDWNRKDNAEAVNPENDPQIRALRTRLSELEDQISNL